MEITTRELSSAEDFNILFQFTGEKPGESSELGRYHARLVKRSISGHQDGIVMAFDGQGAIVGYHHWYVDHYEHDEVVPVRTVVRHTATAEERKALTQVLTTARDHIVQDW